MKQSLLILTLVTACSLSLFAQDESPEELFEDGDFFFAREEYEEAAYLYSQLLRKEPGNHNVHYKLGMAYLNIEGQEEKAISHFLEATENTSLKYRKNHYKEKNAPHHTWFFLGNAYRLNNQLENALEAYETFMSVKNFEKHYNVRITEEEIKAAERAKIIQDAAIDIYRFNFGEPVNTTGKDYNAVISANENVLVWLNSQKFYEAIMMSVKQNGKWSDPVNITPQVGSDGDMIPTGLSADGTELLLIKQFEFDSDIYYSRYDGTFWSKAVPVEGKANSNFTEDHASLSPDGQSMFISSDRRGSAGGLDIWISSKLADGSWSEPVNAGEKVNTEADETSAYLSPDGRQFVFSSKGHYNMGGYDLFQCDVRPDGAYGHAFNMGYPVNTTGDNTFFVPILDGYSGIYCMRDNEGVGGKDIWYVEIIPQEETVAKALTRLSEENFSITIIDKDSKEKITLEYDSVKDMITIRSANGEEYSVIYSREQHVD